MQGLLFKQALYIKANPGNAHETSCRNV